MIKRKLYINDIEDIEDRLRNLEAHLVRAKKLLKSDKIDLRELGNTIALISMSTKNLDELSSERINTVGKEF